MEKDVSPAFHGSQPYAGRVFSARETGSRGNPGFCVRTLSKAQGKGQAQRWQAERGRTTDGKYRTSTDDQAQDDYSGRAFPRARPETYCRDIRETGGA